MQRCNVLVLLSGDRNNSVFKTGVSPAEIKILEDLHGEGSVTEIQPTNMDKDSHNKERSRLRTIYGHHVVDRIFPGDFNRLPVTLKDIAPQDHDDEDEEEDEGGEGEQGQGGDDAAVKARAADAERKRLKRAADKAEADRIAAEAAANEGG